MYADGEGGRNDMADSSSNGDNNSLAHVSVCSGHRRALSALSTEHFSSPLKLKEHQYIHASWLHLTSREQLLHCVYIVF